MDTDPVHDEDSPLSWSIPCATTEIADPDEPGGAVRVPAQGGAGDTRIRVLVLGDRVAVVLPPGDTLVFTRGEAESLAVTLDCAAEHATDT